MAKPEQNAWVERVLGVAVQAGSEPSVSGSNDVQAAIAAWREASEAVDSQIEALAQALRQTGDPELADIAEFGLNAVTGDHKVPLMAALFDVGSGSPENMGKVKAKALAMVQAFQTHIDTDDRVAVCDNNPAQIPVSVRATLGPSLRQLAAALA